VYNEERMHQGQWCYGKTPMKNLSQREDVGGVSGGKTTTDRADLSDDCQMMC
jgi:hypothetical protein